MATDQAFTGADPTTTEWWLRCGQRRLTVQQCARCAHCQLYPRSFCLQCDASDLQLIDASGQGTIYSQTEVHVPMHPSLSAPYVCALVDLDEGPRIVTNIVGEATNIGDRVSIGWLDREVGPPVPIFGALRDIDRP